MPERAAMDLGPLVAPLRGDVVSGAAVIGRRAAGVVRRVAREAPAANVDGLRSVLSRLAAALLDAQPAMAPLVALGTSVLLAVEEAGEVEGARARAAAAAEEFAAGLESGTRAVAEAAVALIPKGGRVLTLSASSTVRAALLAARRRQGRVVCLESRPLMEGRHLAQQLAEAGISVTLAADAAVCTLVQSVDAVLVGADSVGDRGVVNKIGTRAAALAARAAGIPIYVLADRTKLLPPGFPQPTHHQGPADEVWQAPRGVQIWNRYFEATPLDWITGLVTEEGVVDAEAVTRARAALPVPPALQEWARRQAAPASGAG